MNPNERMIIKEALTSRSRRCAWSFPRFWRRCHRVANGGRVAVAGMLRKAQRRAQPADKGFRGGNSGSQRTGRKLVDAWPR